MQVTRPEIGKDLTEFFTGKNENHVTKIMDSRLDILKKQGHILIKRTKIGRNQSCPCGSGLKFKKCCIEKVIKEVI